MVTHVSPARADVPPPADHNHTPETLSIRDPGSILGDGTADSIGFLRFSPVPIRYRRKLSYCGTEGLTEAPNPGLDAGMSKSPRKPSRKPGHGRIETHIYMDALTAKKVAECARAECRTRNGQIEFYIMRGLAADAATADKKL